MSVRNQDRPLVALVKGPEEQMLKTFTKLLQILVWHA